MTARRAGVALPAVAATALALAGCGGTASYQDLRAASAITDIHAATARYVVTFYSPDNRTPDPAAFCLAVGRRSSQALRQQVRRRDETWIPGGRLLARLADLEPPVVPASECEWNEQVQEIHVPSGREAVVLAITEPRFDSQHQASVQVSTRENPTYAFRYQCDLTRDQTEWMVLRCV